MFKNFFFTIFLSLFFVSFLEASNEKINQQIYELKTSQDYAQKINDEKITLIMGQIIQKENEIKELEKELKDYVNKDDLQREINYQNNRIEDINSHVDKLSISVTVVGILITVILLLFTGTFFYVSNKKHLEKVDEWINKNKDKILEPIHEEGKELLKNIENRALKFYQEQLRDLKLDEKLNESQRQTKSEILNKVNELLEHKNKEEYTFDDWFSKYLDAIIKNDYEQGLKFIDKAYKLSSTKDEKLELIFQKAYCLAQLNNNEKALENYLLVLKEFKDEKETSNNELLVSTLINIFELNIILNKEDNEEYINLFKQLSLSDNIIYLDMLNIINKAKNLDQGNEVNSWKEKYNEVHLDWNFNELKMWANSFEDEVVKERLLRYIDIFEKHNESVEEN